MSEELKNIENIICDWFVQERLVPVAYDMPDGSMPDGSIEKLAMKIINTRPAEKVELDVEKVAQALFEYDKLLYASSQRTYEGYAKAICARFRPASVNKLVEALRMMVEQYGGMVDGGVEENARIAVEKAKQALAEFEKGRMSA